MARPATGQVVERRTAKGVVYALRFRAYGEREYLTLGSTSEGWTRRRAEEELQNVLADVRRGQWRRPVEPIGELRPTTVLDTWTRRIRLQRCWRRRATSTHGPRRGPLAGGR